MSSAAPHLPAAARTTPAAAVVFDIDGTLARGSGNFDAMMRAAREVLGSTPRLHHVGAVAHFGDRPVPGWVDSQYLEALAVAAGYRYADVREDLVAALVAAYRDQQAAGSSMGTLLPGVADLLVRLRANGIPIGLATGNLHEVARIKLACFGIAEFFTFSPEAGFGDHHADRAAVVAAALAALPSASFRYHVGDTVLDVEAGRAAGARPVGVCTGAASKQELNAAGAWVVLSDVTGLQELMYLPH